MAMPAQTLSKEGLFTFKLDNKAPVALDDLTESLHAVADAYQDYLIKAGRSIPGEGVRLYVHDLRTGSIIAVFQAIADQARLLFGEHGVVPTVQSAFDHPDTLAGFLGSVNDVVQFFLGNTEGKKEPTKREADQIIKMLEPVAKDNGSQLNMAVGGSVTIGEIHYHYNSQEANAVQNSARRYLGPTLPDNKILHDELLVLAQIRGVPKSKTGDRGIIENISKADVKLLFTSEQIKRDILEAPENPFQQAFIVDVEVKTIDDKPALYKILAVKDSFDRPT
jgi:hypothetical protein